MKEVEPLSAAEEALNKIKKGAFLTVKAGERLNTMTIGWATIGICWRKPVFMIAVRDSRHTFTIIEDAADFTVSIPAGDMQEEVIYCGTKSGRDVDKYKHCSLAVAEGKTVNSPIIDAAGLHFECRIVYKSAMEPDHMTPDFASLYPEKDYHTLYFGEITACYQTF